jgi:hypothetical protein
VPFLRQDKRHPTGTAKLVRNTIGVVAPGFESLQSFFAEVLLEGYAALARRLGDFAEDEGVVEAGGGCVCGGGAVENSIEARPVDCAEAHGAGLGAAVEIAAGQLKTCKLAAGGADGDDFCVGRGVGFGGDAICAFREDFAILHDDGAEGSAAGADVFDGEGDGAGEKFGIEGGGHEERVWSTDSREAIEILDGAMRRAAKV